MQEADGKFQNRFLHYGLLFFIFFVGALTLFSHSILHASHHHDEASPEASGQVVNCAVNNVTTYNVILKDNKFSPNSLTAKACDYLIIRNLDKAEHEPAFGPHQLHQHYPGYEEQTLQQNQAVKIQLVKKGSFTLHDHDNATTRLSLEIN